MISSLSMSRSQNPLKLVVILLLIAGCAHQGTNLARTGGQAIENNDKLAKSTDHFQAGEADPPALHDPELEKIPEEVNPLVEKWVAYFQGRGRPHMERYLSRSTRYSALMKRVLRQNGLPEDLIYVALIESGFSPRATSRAAAVGYWQFIRGTGRRYGLEINALVDERRDPILSTQAAAEYFKGLYSVFGSWYLAMASYNVGENRVQREVMKHMTRDFWELARKRRLPKETINYVPKFIAAKMIGSDPKKFGFDDIDYEKPFEFETLKVSKAVNLKRMAEILGLEYDDFKLMNPKFRGEVAPLRGDQLELRIPLGQRSQALAAAEASFVDKVEFVADAGETETYRVRPGDSLYIIAKRYRTTVAWLRDVNDIKAGKKLRIGMRMQVPDRSSPRKGLMVASAGAKSNSKLQPSSESAAAKSKTLTAAAVAKNEAVAKEDQESAKRTPEIVLPSGVFYIVQSGDTLSSIAEEYDSTVREIRKMNKLKSGQMLRIGTRLKVPPKDEGLPKSPETDDSATGKVENNPPPPPAAPSSVRINKSKKFHVVKRGENLHKIARKYDVSVDRLKKLNQLRTPYAVAAGMKIWIK